MTFLIFNPLFALAGLGEHGFPSPPLPTRTHVGLPDVTTCTKTHKKLEPMISQVRMFIQAQ